MIRSAHRGCAQILGVDVPLDGGGRGALGRLGCALRGEARATRRST